MSDSTFSDASQRLLEALKYVDISDDTIARLKYPKASLKVSIPVSDSKGAIYSEKGMVDETEKICQFAQNKSISMRTAAYVHALRRLEEAVDARGTKAHYLDSAA